MERERKRRNIDESELDGYRKFIALGVVASKMGSIVNVVKEHPEMMQGYGRARKAVRKLVADLDRDVLASRVRHRLRPLRRPRPYRLKCQG